MPKRSPETWRIACLEMSQRAESGAVLYPLIIAFLLRGAGLWPARPAVTLGVMGFTALVAIGRHFLIRRFETFYESSPRLWQAGFFGGLLATCAVMGALLYLLVVRQGLTPSTWFGFALTVGLTAMAAIVYSQALAVVVTYVFLLGIPLVLGLLQLGSGQRWVTSMAAAAVGYLLLLARQQHRERWLSLTSRLQLAARTCESERVRDELERLIAAKTQFLANMSHEIRTPMAGVVGLADLLLAAELDERQAQYVRLIQSSSVSLLRIIDDILDFSKIEAGKLAFEDTTLDLVATLQQVIELLRLGAVAKGTSLRLEMAADLPRWVRGDPARLRQVLINLIGNAVKFTDEGKVDVRADWDAAGCLHVRVHDTGVGIPVEARGRIFEIFSQADDSTSRRYGGTGLGLAISQRIVEGMGGKIGFDSVPGQGSTFWITLDLPLAAGPEHEPPAVAYAKAQRILTAEDNPVNQLVISEHLKALGYEVVAVSDGLEALAALDAGDFDLVLMDCQMPNLDGYEATRRIRRLPGRKAGIPIIALTAHALREDLDRCLEAGMNDTLTKPFQVDTLRRKIERWLGTAIEPGPEPPVEPAPTVPEETPANRQLDLLREIGRASGPAYVARLMEQYRLLFDKTELRQALAKGDRATVQRRIHSLKGASALFGANGLSRLCRQLEIHCADPKDPECLLLLDLIGAEHGRVLEGLNLVFETVSSGQ